MKLIGASLAIAGCCAIGAAAQEIKTTTKEKTKVEVKDGKDIKINGCLTRNLDGAYIVTNDVGALKYVLVTDDNLSKYLGRRIEVKGVAADRGDAKVKIESQVGTTGEIAGRKLDDQKTKTTTTLEGDLDLRYLGVRSVKKIANSCM